MHGLSTKHAVVPAFRIFPQRGEDTAKRGGRRLCIKKKHGNYIVDHGKFNELCFLISVGTLWKGAH